MKGSEKQVKWLEDSIRPEMTKQIQEEIKWLESLAARAVNEEKRQKAKEMKLQAQESLSKLDTIEDARWFINHRNDSVKTLLQEIFR